MNNDKKSHLTQKVKWDFFVVEINRLCKEYQDSCGIFPQKLIPPEQPKETEAQPPQKTKQKVNYIEIGKPKYSTNSVLIATYKVANGINRVIISVAIYCIIKEQKERRMLKCFREM